MDVTSDDLRPRFRRFSLLDLMGIVAAVALGLGSDKFWNESYGTPHTWPDQWTGYIFDLKIWLMLAFWVVLRGFSRPWAERWQPGFIACLSLIVATSLEALGDYSMLRMNSIYRDFPLWRRILIAFLYGPSPFDTVAVASGWLTLWLTDQWRRASGAVEYLGRLVGVMYLGIFIFWTLILYFRPLA